MRTFTHEPEYPIIEIHRIRRENVRKYPTAQALAAYFETVPSAEEFLENLRRNKESKEDRSRDER